MKCEFISVVERDRCIFSGKVDAGLNVGKPWHSQDEVELAQRGDGR